MAARPFTFAARAISRAKAAVHRATAPRSQRSTDVDGQQLVSMLFPGGASAAAAEVVRAAVRDGGVSAATIRRILGDVDQMLTPSPVSVRLSHSDVVYATIDGIEVALDRCDRSVSGPILTDGAWEPHVERVLRECLKPGDVFADVGANVGWHTALGSAIVGSNGFVYAFEPNPDNARLIAHTVRHNRLSNVALLPFALGESTGSAAFRTAIGSNGGFLWGNEPDYLDFGTTIVPTVRFDDLDIVHVDVLKVDVEGAEPFVIGGAEQMIERDRPIIVFEFSADMTKRLTGVDMRDHFTRFASWGYRVSLIDKSGSRSPVDDIDELIRSWDNPFRIEDFIAVPM